MTVPVWGADAINTPTVAGLGNLVNGVLFTAPGHAAPGSKLEAFNEEFKRSMGMRLSLHMRRTVTKLQGLSTLR